MTEIESTENSGKTRTRDQFQSSGVSLKGGHWANWLSVRMIFPSWFAI